MRMSVSTKSRQSQRDQIPKKSQQSNSKEGTGNLVVGQFGFFDDRWRACTPRCETSPPVAGKLATTIFGKLTYYREFLS